MAVTRPPGPGPGAHSLPARGRAGLGSRGAGDSWRTAAPAGRRPAAHAARRLVLLMVLVAAGAASVDVLGDLTQTRADHVAPDSRSEIVLAITTRDYRQPDAEAAQALWAACAGTTNRQLVAEPGIVPLGDGRVRFSVTPALGTNAHRKLVGCLEDATLDRVIGDVESVTLVEP